MIIFVLNNALQINLFVYCNNTPIKNIDPYGFASYTNAITKTDTEKWKIETKIGSFCYNYTLKKGILQMYYDKNNYWSILWRGKAKTLAEAMYKAAKSKNKAYLKGRTIGGIHAELLLHYLGYKTNIKPERTNPVDIGGSFKKQPGYDYNAWWFETASALNMIIKINVLNAVWLYASLIRSIVRYF